MSNLNTDTDRIAAKIRALFAKAEHANTGQAEAEAFAAKAQALLAEYSLSRADIGNTETGEMVVERDRSVTAGPYSIARIELAAAIGRANGVAVVYRGPLYTGTGPKVYEISFAGRDTAVRGVMAMFRQLDAYAASHVSTLRPTPPTREEHIAAALAGRTLANPTTQQFRRSWLFGFAEAIADRLATANASADEAAAGGLLPVLADDYTQARAEFGRVRKAAAPKPIHSKAAAAGASAAHGVDIGQTRIATARPALSA